MVKVYLDEQVLFNMFDNQLTYYLDNDDISEDDADCFREYYRQSINEGYFNNTELDVSVIVGNDIKRCKVVRKGNKYYNLIREWETDPADERELSSFTPFDKVMMVFQKNYLMRLH